MTKHLFIVLVFVFSITGLAACEKSPEDKIVGTWYESDGSETMEFFKDGTIRIVDDGDTMSGSYSVLNESTLKLELGGLGALVGPMLVDYAFDGDDLILTYEGDSSFYSRSQGSKPRVRSSSNSGQGSVSEVSAQVREGLNLSAGAKAAVTEFRMSEGRFPLSNNEAGISDADLIVGRFVSSVAVRDGDITVTYGKASSPAIKGKTLVLTPSADRGSVGWNCGSSDIAEQYLPAACR